MLLGRRKHSSPATHADRTLDAAARPSQTISTDEYARLVQAGERTLVIDVRRDASLDGTGLGPRGGLLATADDVVAEVARRSIPTTTWLVTLCACPREETSGQAAANLQRAGWERARALIGGWKAWRDAGLPMEGGEPKEGHTKGLRATP